MGGSTDLSKVKIVGDLRMGRPTLGGMMSVSVYRLNIYTLRAVLESGLGRKETDEIFRRAGVLAGKVIYSNFLSGATDIRGLLSTAREIFRKSGIGLLEVTMADPQKREFLMSVSEDIDCSGLPNDGETKCRYDEGLISGILEEFYGEEFETTEVQCWATGGHECVFRSNPAGGVI